MVFSCCNYILTKPFQTVLHFTYFIHCSGSVSITATHPHSLAPRTMFKFLLEWGVFLAIGIQK